ncbi:MAG: leucine--tRNA ligase [Planctomycetota bacterium]|nr:leucine--tRNA ligase [Planctomycetota bacterium]
MSSSTPSGQPDQPGVVSASKAPFRYGAVLAEAIESRWQAWWSKQDVFRTPNPGDADFDATKPRFFCMGMFPYPSGAGLHIGHLTNYIPNDIVARYYRMKGRNVLHPMGWDAFGLPAEQYAIETGVHPEETTRNAINTFRSQLKRFGLSCDWSREFATIDPDYYKWTQWIWLQAYRSWYDHHEERARPVRELVELLERGDYSVTGDLEIIESPAREDQRSWDDLDHDEQRTAIEHRRLAYLSEQTVNWCPKLGTVLANEEVIDGRSERGGHPVHRRPLRQWMYRITSYADRLLKDLGLLDWPESTKRQQTEWIGRSEGAEIHFRLEEPFDESLVVYTTRPDTIFGATFMVIAPEHPLVDRLMKNPPEGVDINAIEAYVSTSKNRSDLDRRSDSGAKTGVFSGIHAMHPLNGEQLQVWISDYVLMEYGHGAIMSVPGHDDRDHAFADEFGLPILEVVRPSTETGTDCHAGEGINMNSSSDLLSLDGLHTAEAKASVIAWLEEHGVGRGKINFRLRDWLFSRQRYWGEPFPIVFDEHGHHHGIGDGSLPVELPPLADYEPVESSEPSPLLSKAVQWLETTAGDAGVPANELDSGAPVRREVNTMPGWAGSCWYHIRYCDPHNTDRFVSSEAESYWLGPREGGPGGVDLYIGGAEHAVLHLLYARFWHKLLFDLGLVSSLEPFSKLFHQGILTSFAYQRPDTTLVPVDEVEEVGEEQWVEKATGEGVQRVTAKMSKSLKNVVNPDDVVAEYGADTCRLYEMYLGPLEASKPWNPRDIVGVHRFLQRTWRLAVNEDTGELQLADEVDEAVEQALHRTILKVGEDIERLAFNTAIAALIEFTNTATGHGGVTKDQLDRLSRILSPFAPHVAEELWHKLGHETTVGHATWPTHDVELLKEQMIEMPVQIKGRIRSKIVVAADADEETLREAALSDDRIVDLLGDAEILKVIVVPGRIINIIPG